MKFREIKSGKNKGTHCVYESREEFCLFGNEKKPIIEDWRLGEEGDWVEADDGGIVQILKRGTISHPHDRKNYKNYDNGHWIRTIVGSFIQSKQYEMDTDFSKHPDRYRFNGVSDSGHYRRQLHRADLSKAERIFTASLMVGKSLQNAYTEAFGEKVDWRHRAVALLKRERIIKELNTNIEEIADKLGATYEYIISRLKNLADNSDNENIILGSLKELKDWVKKEDAVKQITQGQVRVFSPISDNELARIEAEKKETLALAEGDE